MATVRRIAALAMTALLAVAAAACSSDSDPESSAAEVAGPGAEVPVADVAARFGDAVWRVETEGCDWLGWGSAFAVDARHLVTNYHVVANDPSPSLRSRDGDVRQARVIGAFVDPDVAVLFVDEDLPLTLPWAATAALEPTERLVVMGYPEPERAFTYSSGSIVNFQGPAGVREAILSNALIDRGNSGGPALRGDGTVAGVVTQMTLDDPAERVAIVLTADTVLPAVEEALANPREVLSECGFGPDYIPPVPDDFDIEAPPAPPAPTSSAASRPAPTSSAGATTRPRPTTTTTTTVPCPGGGVSVAVTQSSASPTEDPESWTVEGFGTVTNDATAPVSLGVVTVDIEGEPTSSIEVDPEPVVLEPAHAAAWAFEGVVVRSPAGVPPVSATVSWLWLEERYANCPTPRAD